MADDPTRSKRIPTKREILEQRIHQRRLEVQNLKQFQRPADRKVSKKK